MGFILFLNFRPLPDFDDGFGLLFIEPMHRGWTGMAAVEEFEFVGFGDEYDGGRRRFFYF